MKHRSKAALLILSAALLMGAPAVAGDIVPLATNREGIETIDVVIAGHRGTFLFDSGIGTSIVTPAFASAIGCKPWGKVTGYRATGERLDLPRCNPASVEIGRLAVTVPQLSVMDLSRVMGSASNGLAGIVGLDAFVGQTLTLDVAHHQLVIEDVRSSARLCDGATQVPIRLVRDAQGAALTVDIGVPTASGMAWMEVDTGNYGPSLVDRSIADLFGLDTSSMTPQDWRVPLSVGTAVTGRVIVKDLVLDGNLGREVLRHYLISLDLKHGRGWIKAVDRPTPEASPSSYSRRNVREAVPSELAKP